MVLYNIVIFVIVLYLCSALAVLPQYTLAIEADGLNRDEIIEKYFNLGLNYVEILGFLVNIHGIRLYSLRQLKRILSMREVAGNET